MVKSVVKTFCWCFFEKGNTRKSQCLQGRFLNDCKAFRGFAFRAERVFARGCYPPACMLPKQARYQLRYIPIYFLYQKETRQRASFTTFLLYHTFLFFAIGKGNFFIFVLRNKETAASAVTDAAVIISRYQILIILLYIRS